jgi:hypothetical protein
LAEEKRPLISINLLKEAQVLAFDIIRNNRRIKMDENLGIKWPVKVSALPKLSSKQWLISQTLGVILLVMAVAQLMSFSKFADSLTALDFSIAKAGAAAILFFEFWAAISFLKLKQSRGFRTAGNCFAIIVALFWFIDACRAAAESAEGSAMGTNFFGNYLSMSAGWNAVIEATVFAALVGYTLVAIRSVNSRKRK